MASLLTGDPPLWTLIDTYIYNLCVAWAADLDELQGATIAIAEQYNPDAVTYPFILIVSYESGMAEAEPRIGSGNFELAGLRYPYQIAITQIFPTLADAKRFAAAARASFIDALRADPTFGGLAATNGEVMEQFEFEDGELFIRGVAGQDHGEFVSTAVVAIIVHAELGSGEI